LETFDEIDLDPEIRQKLLEISAATIDCLLAPVKREYQLKARFNTKPGTLLKHQIPIRTFSEWDEAQPGFVEIDLVAHNGGDPRGDSMNTLDVTDVCTQWTETRGESPGTYGAMTPRRASAGSLLAWDQVDQACGCHPT